MLGRSIRPANNDHLGTVFLISEATRLADAAALLRRFGFEVREMCRIPTPAQISPRDRCEVQLVIVDESLRSDEDDPQAWLAGMLAFPSILIVPRAASSAPARFEAASQRLYYLAPSFSPIDLTLAIAEMLRRRKSCAN